MKPIKPMYVLILVIVVAAAGFYGGSMYQKSHQMSFAEAAGGGQFGARRFGGAGANSMRPVSGDIVSQGNNTITVKLSDGSSKIINLTSQTTINKASKGTTSDLKSGEHVTTFGTTNSDGSVTAQMVSVGNSMLMMRGSTGNPPSQNRTNGPQQ